ncbi:MAG: prolipoprotein diacylglyceryl transferase [Bacilli bacterium]|nr:prolipoprotein diacylglyceryl transferase [Bacilli bacterium]
MFIIFAVAAIGVGVYSFKENIGLVRSKMIDVDFRKVTRTIGLCNGVFALCFTLMLAGGILWGEYPADAIHWIMLIFGGLFFSFSLITAVQFFILYYWGKNIDEKWHKFYFMSFIGLFIVAIPTLFLWLDGYAPYLTYPLVNGISFNDGFVTPATGKPNLAWYAICIVSGAVLVYAISDHLLYKEYGKHGIGESTFFVAFPAGVIGARLWYCIGEGKPIADWIKIWEGGLTVVGGALTGIIVGVLWFIWRNPKYSIFVAIDCAVPTILIAQAIGRWGNFFNCEVHGLEVSAEYFKWLPEIIRNNAAYSCEYGFASSGNIYLPLFLIEGIINLFGYFVLAHLFGKRLHKYLEPADLGFGYIVWYGMTRVILEPFRDGKFNMGNNGYWSWIWCLLYVLIGSIGIIANHVIRYLIKKHKGTYIVQKGDIKIGSIETIVFAAVGLVLVVVGTVLMVNAPGLQEGEARNIGFGDSFNVGLMLLIVGVSIAVYVVPAAIRFIEGIKKQKSIEAVNE